MNDDDNSTQAREWAEESENPNTLALTHAILYVGDVLSDILLELEGQNGDEPEVQPRPDSKLAQLLSKPAPFASSNDEVVTTQEDLQAALTNGTIALPDGVQLGVYRKFPAKHHPGDWKKLPDGKWESPTGRKYGAYSRQVIGVVKARKKLGLPI